MWRGLVIFCVLMVALSVSLWLTLTRTGRAADVSIPLRGDFADQHITVNLRDATSSDLLRIYGDLTGRRLLCETNPFPEKVDMILGGKLSRWKLLSFTSAPDSGLCVHRDGLFSAEEIKAAIETHLRTNGLVAVPVGTKAFRVVTRLD